MKLTLKPFGPVDADVLQHLREQLTFFDAVAIAKVEPLPAEAWDRRRKQYRASDLERLCEPEPGERVLGVTAADLYAPYLNFVFGHASIGGRTAVISLARLGNDGREKLYERAVKEAVHELGHTFGLMHDEENPRCVMHFSRDLADTDRKGREFCPACQASTALIVKRLRK